MNLNELDLQGYSLGERLRGIALMLDPIRADIVRYAVQLLEDIDKQVHGINAAERKSYLLATIQRIQDLTRPALNADTSNGLPVK